MSTRQRQPAGLFETLRREMRLKGYSHETMKEYQGGVSQKKGEQIKSPLDEAMKNREPPQAK